MSATEPDDLPGPKIPPFPEDILDMAAVERWLAHCYPRDGETYEDGLRRMAKGMMMVMCLHLRMMQDDEVMRRLKDDVRRLREAP